MTSSYPDNSTAQNDFDPPLGDSQLDLDFQLLTDWNAYMADTQPAVNQDNPLMQLGVSGPHEQELVSAPPSSAELANSLGSEFGFHNPATPLHPSTGGDLDPLSLRASNGQEYNVEDPTPGSDGSWPSDFFTSPVTPTFPGSSTDNGSPGAANSDFQLGSYSTPSVAWEPENTFDDTAWARHTAPVAAEPLRQDPIYDAWLAYLMECTTREIQNGGPQDFASVLTPGQLDTGEEQEPLDYVPWVAEKDFKPHSPRDLMQMEVSYGASEGCEVYFMKAKKGNMPYGRAGSGYTAKKGNMPYGRAGSGYTAKVREISAVMPRSVLDSFGNLTDGRRTPEGAGERDGSVGHENQPEGVEEHPQAPKETDYSLQGPTNSKYKVLDYTNNALPGSGLIRDGVAPMPDDFSNNALVWRVANSATGRQVDFTFAEHWWTIYDSLHGPMLDDLNRRLVNGLPGAKRMALLRNLPERHFKDEHKNRMIAFAKKDMQLQVNWKNCPEHMRILKTVDLENPYFDLAELDRLAKAAGVWLFVATSDG